MDIQNKTITEFLDKEYKDYSFYTIENRAIASVIDGLKPTQRKVIFVAEKIWRNLDLKPLRVFQLAGRIASEAYYHHGDQSLSNAIITMSQKFKNNLPLLDGEGIIGFLRAPEPSAARYVGAKLSKNFRLLYKDFELISNREDEGNIIEPEYYLPIIPTILVNGSSGLAVGHASNILNRTPKDLIDSCILYLKNGKFSKITPMINEFDGDWISDSENSKRWIIRGKFQRLNTTTVKITEIPPSLTYEKYDEILDKLVEAKHVVSYDDNCKSNIEYIVKFNREALAGLDDEKLIKLLKLEDYQTENFTTLDESGKLKIFESVQEIVKYFVDFRLTYYSKRKAYLLNKLNYDKNILANKGKFIKAILDNKLDVKNKSKNEIVLNLEKMEFLKIEETYDYLLRMPLWSLTTEQFQKLKEDFAKLKEEIIAMEATDPKDTYLQELVELKKQLK